jgi:hypothetical protein
MADGPRTERSRYGRIVNVRQDRPFDQSGINFPPLGARRRTWQRRKGITTARLHTTSETRLSDPFHHHIRKPGPVRLKREGVIASVEILEPS